MKSNVLVAIERDGSTGRITRALDLASTECVEIDGGDVVFAAELARTDDGDALARVGDAPVAVTSVYSECDLRAALADANYPTSQIDHALAVRLRGENGRRAARIAESYAHDHPTQLRETDAETPAVATDGGRETCDRCPTPLADVHAAHEATVVTTEGSELCPECADARTGEEIGFVTASHSASDAGSEDDE